LRESAFGRRAHVASARSSRTVRCNNGALPSQPVFAGEIERWGRTVNCRRASLLLLPLVLAACATAHVTVSQAPPPAPPKFTRVAVPPFANGVGAALPATAPDEAAGAVIAEIHKDSPQTFSDISAVSSNGPGELIVRGTIMSYDPGSKAARFILIGL